MHNFLFCWEESWVFFLINSVPLTRLMCSHMLLLLWSSGFQGPHFFHTNLPKHFCCSSHLCSGKLARFTKTLFLYGGLRYILSSGSVLPPVF